VNTIPRRLASVVLHFRIEGRGIVQSKAERAVELSITKYCSVRSSLAEDIPVTWTVKLA
jgi:putative redox protein